MREVLDTFIKKLNKDLNDAKLLVAKFEGAIEAVQVLIDEDENSKSKRIQETKDKHKTDVERRVEELEEELAELKESLATLNSRVFRLLQVLQNQDDHAP